MSAKHEERPQPSDTPGLTNAKAGADKSVRVPTGVPDRILNQMARELLLAQSSDWAFQIYQGTTVQYSTRRFQSHIQRFDMLAKMLERDVSPDDLALLAEIERRDNIFPEIDHSVFCTRVGGQ